jgi:site-specific recombinase XerC
VAWCEDAGVPSIAVVQPLHIAAWTELQTREHSAPTAKQRLAAVRHLFDWLVTGQAVPTNPAASVRGPAHGTVASLGVRAPERYFRVCSLI